VTRLRVRGRGLLFPYVLSEPAARLRPHSLPLRDSGPSDCLRLIGCSSLVKVAFCSNPCGARFGLPWGQTPIRYPWDRHVRLSVICALTVAPWEQRFGLYYELLDHNCHAVDLMRFLRFVHHHLRPLPIAKWRKPGGGFLSAVPRLLYIFSIVRIRRIATPTNPTSVANLFAANGVRTTRA